MKAGRSRVRLSTRPRWDDQRPDCDGRGGIRGGRDAKINRKVLLLLLKAVRERADDRCGGKVTEEVEVGYIGLVEHLDVGEVDPFLRRHYCRRRCVHSITTPMKVDINSTAGEHLVE